MTIRTLTLAAVLLTTVAAVAESTYTVRRGDTLHKISKKLGISADALRELNGLETAKHLHKGQILKLPSSPKASSEKTSIGTAEVIAQTVTPHAGPFDGSKALGALTQGTSGTAIEEKPGWVKLDMAGQVAWLPSDAVKITQPAVPVLALALPSAKRPATFTSISKESVIAKIASSHNPLLKKALTYRGVRYRWGGTSRSSGVDCSGFTTSVFKSQGIMLPRTALQQSHIGSAVSKGALRPGDLVFFRTSRSVRINHVGIYVGDGKFIHAATGAGHVMVSSLSDSYYERCYAAARRVADNGAGSRVAAESQTSVQN